MRSPGDFIICAKSTCLPPCSGMGSLGFACGLAGCICACCDGFGAGCLAAPVASSAPTVRRRRVPARAQLLQRLLVERRLPAHRDAVLVGHHVRLRRHLGRLLQSRTAGPGRSCSGSSSGRQWWPNRCPCSQKIFGDMTRKITTIMCTTTEIQNASRSRERSRSSSNCSRRWGVRSKPAGPSSAHKASCCSSSGKLGRFLWRY